MRRPPGLWLAIFAGAARILLSILLLPLYGKRKSDDR